MNQYMSTTSTATSSSGNTFLDDYETWLYDHCPCAIIDNNNNNEQMLMDYYDAGIYNKNEHYDAVSSSHNNYAANDYLLGGRIRRYLAGSDEKVEPEPELWESIVVSITLIIMFYFMLTDKIVPDWVMTAGLVTFMACKIITVKEGLEGFANEGILTVMALFVVAEGISRTGTLDYYLGLLLGRPKTIAGAQIRLMVPIAFLSAFLNNTPIVAVMIPLTLRWAKNSNIPKEQLLMPLSYATILGGTCTLVGTSTNLVVSGLLKKNFPDEPAGNIGLFDLAIYGVPNAMIGLAYMLACAPFLLPGGGGKKKSSGSSSKATSALDADELLLGARVRPWSPAAGRTYKRSGLGNSGGIFLVNVRRAASGNIHRAVSKDFVLSVNDELYFTGSVEKFSSFCQQHGLEVLTTENMKQGRSQLSGIKEENDNNNNDAEEMENGTAATVNGVPTLPPLMAVKEVQTGSERLPLINYISDQIHGDAPVNDSDPDEVIVAFDHSKQAVLIGVNCLDRPGLVADITKVIGQHNLDLRHSEAKVIGIRSLLIFGCENMNKSDNGKLSPDDLDEVWSDLYDTMRLSSNQAVTPYHKHSGTRVVRAIVTKESTLIGKKPMNISFKREYKASIVAYQKSGGKNALMNVELNAGDLLVLETKSDSPLLQKAPKGFYDKLKRSGSSSRLLGLLMNTTSTTNNDNSTGGGPEDTTTTVEKIDPALEKVWKDLKVLSIADDDDDDVDTNKMNVRGEFITAFTLTADSPLKNKSLSEMGYAKLGGVVLIGIERPASSNTTNNNADTTALTAHDPLAVGDIIWYLGSAEAIAALQKINGLVFYQTDADMKQGIKSTAKLTERRLVQAVVARTSPLIGKTIKDVHFRSEYGGAVIAIQRGSERVHEHPANVKLQTGDVLLVEAGTFFVDKYSHDYRTFALVREVENSSPPRPKWFVLCLILIVAMLLVAGLEVLSLLITAALAGIVMVSFGILTQQEARDALQWDLFVTVACAFGIGNAMENSGVADAIAKFLVKLGQSIGIGDAGVYGSVYLAGNLMSAVLTNNAAATLMFPIAMNAVDRTGADRSKMAYIIMLSASDYITSFGYQTNLMVYGPGEYANLDFFKFGAPMQILLWLSTTALVSTFSLDDTRWLISWAICAVGFIVVALFRLVPNASSAFKGREGKSSTEQEQTVSAGTGGMKRENSWQFADMSPSTKASNE